MVALALPKTLPALAAISLLVLLVSSASAGATVHDDETPLAAAQSCERLARFSSLQKSSPSCWVDTPPAGSEGSFDYACGGGDAHLRFGKYDYRGTVTAGVLAFSLVTEFDWQDGCHWKSEQRVDGPVSGPLVFTYAEYPIRGSGCMPSCSARGDITIAAKGGR